MTGFVRLRKTVWRHFNIYDRERMQKFLERQALKGWVLDDFTGNFWYFRREVPKKRHYSIVYMPKKTMTEDAFNQRVGEFQAYCSHAGWKCEAADDYIRIYYNDREDPTPIETDPYAELESMRQIVRARRILNIPVWYPIFMIIMMLNFSVRRYGVLTGLFFSHLSFTVALIGLTYVLRLLVQKISHCVWLNKAKKELSLYGSFSGFGNYAYLDTVLLTVILILYIISCVITHNLSALIPFGMALLFLLLMVCIITQASRIMTFKAKQLVAVLAFIGCFVLLVVASKSLTPTLEKIHTQTGAQPPVIAQDVAAGEYEVRTESWDRDESLFAASYRYSSYIVYPDDKEIFHYTVTTVKLPFLYESSFTAIKDSYGDWERFVEVSAEDWNAEHVYLWGGDYGRSIYVVCYENAILEIDNAHELPQEQIVLLTEKLTSLP